MFVKLTVLLVSLLMVDMSVARSDPPWSELPIELRRVIYDEAINVEESTSYTIPESGRVQHAIWEAFSATCESSFEGDEVHITNSERRIPDGDVFQSFAISGDVGSLSAIRLVVGGQEMWNSKSIVKDEHITPLGIKWPFVCMTHSNMFLWIEGRPGDRVTISESFRKEPCDRLRALAKTTTLIPQGHNPLNLISVKFMGGMVGMQYRG